MLICVDDVPHTYTADTQTKQRQTQNKPTHLEDGVQKGGQALGPVQVNRDVGDLVAALARAADRAQHPWKAEQALGRARRDEDAEELF